MAKVSKVLGTVPMSRGAFNATKTYYKDNIVQYQGCTYQCVSDTPVTGVMPEDGSVWRLWGGTGSGITNEQIQDFQDQLDNYGVNNPYLRFISSKILIVDKVLRTDSNKGYSDTFNYNVRQLVPPDSVETNSLKICATYRKNAFSRSWAKSCIVLYDESNSDCLYPNKAGFATHFPDIASRVDSNASQLIPFIENGWKIYCREDMKWYAMSADDLVEIGPLKGLEDEIAGIVEQGDELASDVAALQRAMGEGGATSNVQVYTIALESDIDNLTLGQWYDCGYIIYEISGPSFDSDGTFDYGEDYEFIRLRPDDYDDKDDGDIYSTLLLPKAYGDEALYEGMKYYMTTIEDDSGLAYGPGDFAWRYLGFTPPKGTLAIFMLMEDATWTLTFAIKDDSITDGVCNTFKYEYKETETMRNLKRHTADCQTFRAIFEPQNYDKYIVKKKTETGESQWLHLTKTEFAAEKQNITQFGYVPVADRVDFFEFESSNRTLSNQVFNRYTSLEYYSPAALGLSKMAHCCLTSLKGVDLSGLTTSTWGVTASFNHPQFEGCTQLQEVIMPDYIQGGSGMFSNCDALERIDFRNPTLERGDEEEPTSNWVRGRFADHCSNLKYIDMWALDQSMASNRLTLSNLFSLEFVRFDSGFLSENGIAFERCDRLGTDLDYRPNFWWIHLNACCPRVTDGRWIALPGHLCEDRWAALNIACLQNKGYSIVQLSS